MSSTTLEDLFERYRRDGDLPALAALFDRAAPELMRVARHLCRSEGEAEDLVQSTFLVAIERADAWDAARPLSPWLVGISRKLRQRRGDRAELGLQGEERADRRARDPQEDAAEREVASQVGEAIDTLPPPYQEVLDAHLREGLAAPEIARRFGRRAGTVHVQLHRGLRRLRRLLPAGAALGGALWVGSPRGLAAVRRQVVAAARPVALGKSAAGSSLLVLGGIGVQKVLIGAVIALGALGAWWGARDGGRTMEPQVGLGGPLAEAPSPSAADGEASHQPEGLIVEREALASIDPAATGDLPEPPYGRLELVVRYSDGEPASGVQVELTPHGEAQPELHAEWRVTDDAGRLVLARAHSGLVEVRVVRARFESAFEVVGGELASHELVLDPLIDVAGVVLDSGGKPLSGARVWAGTELGFDASAVELGVTGADGRFAARGLDQQTVISATALGFERGETAQIGQLPAGEVELRLERTLEASARVKGTVLGSAGEPLQGVPVLLGRIGEGPKLRTRMRLSDEHGRFEFDGLRRGQLFVHARAPGLAGEFRKFALRSGADEELELRLDQGARVVGRMTDAQGEPAGHGVVAQEIEFPRAYFEPVRTRAAADGSYELRGITPGEVVLVAQATLEARVRQLSTRLELAPGETAAWHPRLGSLGSIHGRVVDESGVGLIGWSVRVVPLRTVAFYPDAATSDEAGRFEIVDCAAVPHLLEVFAPGGFEQPRATLEGAVPSTEELVIRVRAADAPSAWLLGRITNASGGPLVGAWVEARHESLGSLRAEVDAQGMFELGPLAPGEVVVELGFERRTFHVLDPITLAPDERRELGTLRYGLPGALQLILTDPAGAALERPVLVLRDSFGFGHLGRGEDGIQFRFEGLQPGSYTLVPLCADGVTRTRVVEIVEGETTYLELTLEPGVQRQIVLRHPPADVPPDSIHVVLRDAAGEQLFAWESLALDRRAEPVEYAVVGTFAVGSYTLEASSPLGASLAASFTVERLEPVEEALVFELEP